MMLFTFHNLKSSSPLKTFSAKSTLAQNGITHGYKGSGKELQ